MRLIWNGDEFVCDVQNSYLLVSRWYEEKMYPSSPMRTWKEVITDIYATEAEDLRTIEKATQFLAGLRKELSSGLMVIGAHTLFICQQSQACCGCRHKIFPGDYYMRLGRWEWRGRRKQDGRLVSYPYCMHCCGLSPLQAQNLYWQERKGGEEGGKMFKKDDYNLVLKVAKEGLVGQHWPLSKSWAQQLIKDFHLTMERIHPQHKPALKVAYFQYKSYPMRLSLSEQGQEVGIYTVVKLESWQKDPYWQAGMGRKEGGKDV